MRTATQQRRPPLGFFPERLAFRRFSDQNTGTAFDNSGRFLMDRRPVNSTVRPKLFTMRCDYGGS